MRYGKGYREGQIAALTKTILWCGKQLSKIPVVDQRFSSYCETINFLGKARTVLLAGGSFNKSGALVKKHDETSR